MHLSESTWENCVFFFKTTQLTSVCCFKSKRIAFLILRYDYYVYVYVHKIDICSKTVISLESVDQQSLTICHMLLSISKLGSYCAIMGMPLPFPFCCHFRFPYRLEISSSSLLPPHVFIHFLKLELPSQAMKYMWNPMSPFTILYGVSGKDVVRRNGS